MTALEPGTAVPVKPLLRGWLHLISFEVSLVLGTLALVHAHGALRVTAVAIFVVSVTGMFGVSGLYHVGTWGPVWHARLQRLDHAMIFLLIAGTATSAFLLASHGVYRTACLIALWILTLTAGAIHMAWMNAPELLVGSTFVALGWAGDWRCQPSGCTPAPPPGRCCSRGACSTRWARCPTAGAGPTRTRPSSATTRSSTFTSAPPRPASLPLSRSSSPDRAAALRRSAP